MLNKRLFHALLILSFFYAECAFSQVWDNKIIELHPHNYSLNNSNLDELRLIFKNPVDTVTGFLTIFSEEGAVIHTYSLETSEISGKGSDTIRISIPEMAASKESSFSVAISPGAFGKDYPGMKRVEEWNFSKTSYHREHIKSEIVKDSFQLFITLPDNYNPQREKPYPVVYALDGNSGAYVGHNNTALRFMREEKIPEIIFIGVGYPDKYNADLVRLRDFNSFEGILNFNYFLKKELLPYCDKVFNADENNRSLIGFSLGGLFGVFPLFNTEEIADRTFKNFSLSDPTLFVADTINGVPRTVFTFEQAYFNKSKELPVKLFMGTGNDIYKTNLYYCNKFDSVMNCRNYKGLDYVYHISDIGNHVGLRTPHFELSLQWFFDGVEIPKNQSGTTEFSLEKLKISPNPSSGIITIESETDLKQIALYSLTGEKLKGWNRSGIKRAVLDLYSFDPGIYLLQAGNNLSKIVLID